MNVESEIERRFAALVIKYPDSLAAAPPVSAFDDPFTKGFMLAAHQLRAEGRTIDTAALVDRLGATAIGSVLALGRLDVPETAQGLASLILAEDRKRRTQRLLVSAHQRHRYGELDLEQLAVDARALADVTPKSAEPKKGPRSIADRVLALGSIGERHALQLAALDHATRGGLVARTVTLLLGPPGAGKTTLVVQLARQFYVAGLVVVVHAADENADGLLIRVGQGFGLAREDLEQGNAGAKRHLADRIADGRLVLVDQDEDDMTIEDSAELAERLGRERGVQAVLVPDSIQTLRTRIVTTNPRERIDAVIATLKYAAKARGLIVIATSEVARGFYRGGGSDRTEALASGKESGGIEYGASLLLALSSVKDESNVVEVEVAKNRLGAEKPTFRLELDRDRASFSETTMPDAPSADDRAAAKESAKEAVVARMMAEMPRALAQAAGSVTNRRELQALVRGANDLRVEAASRLIATGVIVGGSGKPYRVNTSEVSS